LDLTIPLGSCGRWVVQVGIIADIRKLLMFSPIRHHPKMAQEGLNKMTVTLQLAVNSSSRAA
jgi:hypothetical protein